MNNINNLTKFFTKPHQLLQILCNVLKHHAKIVNEPKTLSGETQTNLQNGNVILSCRFRFRFKLEII